MTRLLLRAISLSTGLLGPVLGWWGTRRKGFASLRHTAEVRFRRPAFLVLLALASCFALVVPAAASASDVTWTGGAPPGQPSWSDPRNWGGVAPGAGDNLIFPKLNTPACTALPLTATCYSSVNDFSALQVGTLTFGCGGYAGYGLQGSGFTLAGGLTAYCVGETVRHVIDTRPNPITLSAAQSWLVQGDTNAAYSNTVSVYSVVAGQSHRLTVQLVDNAILDLTARVLPGGPPVGDVEVGPAEVTGVGDGTLALEGGQLNASDRNPVTLQGVTLVGGGAVGPLTSFNSRIEYADLTIAGDATFDPATRVRMSVEPLASSQIVVEGIASLGGTLDLDADGQEFCPQPGDQFVLFRASRIGGGFANLPDGSTTQVECQGSTITLRIEYTASSVTATVLGASPGTTPSPSPSPSPSPTPTTPSPPVDGGAASRIVASPMVHRCDVPCSQRYFFRATDASGVGVANASVRISVASVGPGGAATCPPGLTDPSGSCSFTETTGPAGLGSVFIPDLVFCPGNPSTCHGEYHVKFTVSDAAGVSHTALATVKTSGTMIGDMFVSPAIGNQFARTGVGDFLYRPWMKSGFVPITVAVYDEFGNQYYDGVTVRFTLSGPARGISRHDRVVHPFGLDPTYSCNPVVFPNAGIIPPDFEPGATQQTYAPSPQQIAKWRADYLAANQPWPCELSHFPQSPYGNGLRLPFDPFRNANFHRFLAPQGAVDYVLPPNSSTPTLDTITVLARDKTGSYVCPPATRACPLAAQVAFVDPQAVSDKDAGKAESLFLQLLDMATCGIGLLGEGPTGGLDSAATIYGCGRSFAGLVDMAALQRDPPDLHAKTVLLPVITNPPRLTGSTLCRPPTRHIKCVTLLAAERGYVKALSTVGAYQEASAIAIDRYGGGGRLADAHHMLAQQAAAYVYLAELARATRQLARAGRALGALLAKSGKDVLFKAPQVQQIRNDLLQLKGVPRGVLAELRKDGVAPTAADVVASLRSAFALAGPPHAVHLSTVLAQSPAVGGFKTQAQHLSPLHLQALVHILAGQHLISRRTRAALGQVIATIRTACNGRSRAYTGRRFIGVAARRTHGAVRSLLIEAARFLARYHKGTSAPLPRCK